MLAEFLWYIQLYQWPISIYEFNSKILPAYSFDLYLFDGEGLRAEVPIGFIRKGEEDRPHVNPSMLLSQKNVSFSLFSLHRFSTSTLSTSSLARFVEAMRISFFSFSLSFADNNDQNKTRSFGWPWLWLFFLSLFRAVHSYFLFSLPDRQRLN